METGGSERADLPAHALVSLHGAQAMGTLALTSSGYSPLNIPLGVVHGVHFNTNLLEGEDHHALCPFLLPSILNIWCFLSLQA